MFFSTDVFLLSPSTELIIQDLVLKRSQSYSTSNVRAVEMYLTYPENTCRRVFKHRKLASKTHNFLTQRAHGSFPIVFVIKILYYFNN